MSELPYTLVLPEGFVRVPLPGLSAWVTALRSGEYRQGRNPYLYYAGQYCCLGVLSHVQGRLDPAAVVGNDGVQCSGLDDDNPCFRTLGHTGCLPKSVEVLFLGDSLGRLAQLNDLGMSFGQIADVLEAVFVEADEGVGAPAEPLPTTANGSEATLQPSPTSFSAEEVRV